MAQIERIQTRRWSRVEYDRLIEHGFLDEDEPIELLDGLLVVKEPQGRPHVTAEDYWVLDVLGRRLEIHRDPIVGRGPRSRYRSIQIFGANDTVSPLAMPSARVAVADLLP